MSLSLQLRLGIIKHLWRYGEERSRPCAGKAACFLNNTAIYSEEQHCIFLRARLLQICDDSQAGNGEGFMVLNCSLSRYHKGPNDITHAPAPIHFFCLTTHTYSHQFISQYVGIWNLPHRFNGEPFGNCVYRVEEHMKMCRNEAAICTYMSDRPHVWKLFISCDWQITYVGMMHVMCRTSSMRGTHLHAFRNKHNRNETIWHID